jgi:UPF0042 nucleotide-binding protein
MITLKSHGFKYSRPEANFIFDVSYFANPWRDKEIREETDVNKRRELIVNFMMIQSGCQELVESIGKLAILLERTFPTENLKIALCCSAGEYRSPAMLMMVGKYLESYRVDYKADYSLESKI